jgi:transposase
VFEIAVAGKDWRITERRQLNRAKFLRFFVQRPPCDVVMEACGSAHHWGRHMTALGHNVRLLPAHYVKKYVRRNKTDRADAAALIEAARCADMRAVPIKTIEQQKVLSLHRIREQWKSARHRYVNVLRGTLREFGVFIPLGIEVGTTRIGAALADATNEIPDALRVCAVR